MESEKSLELMESEKYWPSKLTIIIEKLSVILWEGQEQKGENVPEELKLNYISGGMAHCQGVAFCFFRIDWHSLKKNLHVFGKRSL